MQEISDLKSSRERLAEKVPAPKIVRNGVSSRFTFAKLLCGENFVCHKSL